MRTRLAILGGITVALLVACPSRTSVVSDNTQNQKPVETPAIVVQPEVPPTQTPILNPKGISILSMTDQNGVQFDVQDEINDNKVARLLAAQYEDPLCLRVRVQDATQTVVANAQVKVESTSLRGVTISPGCVAGSVAPAAFEQVTTDANGEARFTIFAPTPAQIIDDAARILSEPIKFVITASNGQVAAQPAEFKVFYLNMSHLRFLDSDGHAVTTARRWGSDLGPYRNIFLWDRRGVPQSQLNIYQFMSVAYQLQPQDGPFPIGTELIDVNSMGFGSLVGKFPGYLRYRLADPTKVQFVGCPAGGLSAGPNGELYCETNGPLGIQPRSNVTPADLPLTANISVTYVATIKYGDICYKFELKNYTFTKTWIGSYATIAKSVDNHVLTWAGPDFYNRLNNTGSINNQQRETLLTLTATDQTNVVRASEDVLTTTVRLHITNPGNAPLYRLLVRDAVPAELGVITDGAGIKVTDGNWLGTYDKVNHSITWRWNDNTSLNTLAAGASLDITFRVYARQKPGFCWDNGADVASTGLYSVKPGQAVSQFLQQQAGIIAERCNPYADPYRVINGRLVDDVTVAYYMSDDFSDDYLGVQNKVNQQLSDYTPTPAGESDIWVVRPLYDISKTLATPYILPILRAGESATFNITQKQIDRWTSGAYAQLRAWFPNEFPGGTGRLNPYGIGLRFEDHWSNNLEFTDATQISVTRGGNAIATYPTQYPLQRIGNPAGPLNPDVKALQWIVPDYQIFAANDQAKTSMILAANGSLGVISEGTNCAFQNADNLNQPVFLRGFPVNSYTTRQWRQDEGLFYFDGSNTGSPVSNANPAWRPTPATSVNTWTDESWIATCAYILIGPREGALVGFSGRHEFNTLDSTLNGITDPYHVGTSFSYKYDALNIGPNVATGAHFEISLPNGSTVVSFVSGAKIYTSSDNGVTFTLAPINFTMQTSTMVVSENFDMTPNVVYRLVVPAMAVAPSLPDGEPVHGYLRVNSTGQDLHADDETVVVP